MPEVQKPILEHATEEDGQGLTPSVIRTETLPEGYMGCQVSNVGHTCGYCGGSGLDLFPRTWWELQEWIQTGRTRVYGESPVAT